MTREREFLDQLAATYAAARASDDGRRCAVAPHPELRRRINDAVSQAARAAGLPALLTLRPAEPKQFGLNDGVILPPELFPLGTPPSAIRNAAADRAPLRGAIRVIVVLVDFSDKAMTQTAAHYRDLFFSVGVLPKKSVREYFQDVTNGLIDIQGDVVGPLRLPQTLVTYANGASGIGPSLPNARSMADDAVVAANPAVNFTPYDNDGNGFVDAFIVIHAGAAAEVTGSANDIWSHKWVLPAARSVDSTQIFAYLTVPEDCKIGVCAHELGHLLFGFPDLYDTDGTSEGVGNWCLMAGGSWGGGGDTPAHPSAWCKANQGWVSVDNRSANGPVSIADVKASRSVLRLWKDGGPGNEYFLVENRQQSGFDASLPAGGLLIWHIDETQSGNTDENRYKVALMQADGRRDLELNRNRGDAGDPFPGSSNNTAFTATSTPNSKSYSNTDTCVAVTGISASGPAMTANLQVKCGIKLKDVKDRKEKDLKDFKEKDLKDRKEKDFKEFKELKEKDLKDRKEKDFKEFKEKDLKDRKEKDIKEFREKDFEAPFGPRAQHSAGYERELEGAPEWLQLEARIAALEAALGGAGAQGRAEPFIGSELRPDLGHSALAAEDDLAQLGEQMKQGSAQAKRVYDSKTGR
jgi:immune inhibitor A